MKSYITYRILLFRIERKIRSEFSTPALAHAFLGSGDPASAYWTARMDSQVSGDTLTGEKENRLDCLYWDRFQVRRMLDDSRLSQTLTGLDRRLKAIRGNITRAHMFWKARFLPAPYGYTISIQLRDPESGFTGNRFPRSDYGWVDIDVDTGRIVDSGYGSSYRQDNLPSGFQPDWYRTIPHGNGLIRVFGCFRERRFFSFVTDCPKQWKSLKACRIRPNLVRRP